MPLLRSEDARSPGASLSYAERLVLQQLAGFSRHAQSCMARVGQAACRWTSLVNWAAVSLREAACELGSVPRNARGSWNRTPLGPLIERTLAEQARQAKQAKQARAGSPCALARDPFPVGLGPGDEDSLLLRRS
jgi:hypothetical protein